MSELKKEERNYQKELEAPFRYGELEFKPQTTGFTQKGAPWARLVTYVQARAIQKRLDEVFGVFGWKTSYRKLKDGWICTISVKAPFDFPRNAAEVWVDKEDGAEPTDIEAFKGGISSAFKRAAVVWGIGRYLYEFPVLWAEFGPKDAEHTQAAKIGGDWFHYKPVSFKKLPPNMVSDYASLMEEDQKNVEAQKEKKEEELQPVPTSTLKPGWKF